MSKPLDPRSPTTRQKVEAEVADSFDEELELELDNDRLLNLIDGFADNPDTANPARATYFKELFRRQRELVKLQDWVVHKKLKVVALFEGRDAAGKGGAIKRVTQRLNPRVCRVVALPAPVVVVEPSQPTLEVCWRAHWLVKEPRLSNGKHRDQWASTMDACVLPRIGKRPVADVTGSGKLTRLATRI